MIRPVTLSVTHGLIIVPKVGTVGRRQNSSNCLLKLIPQRDGIRCDTEPFCQRLLKSLVMISDKSEDVDQHDLR
jgi:hypothetical protein